MTIANILDPIHIELDPLVWDNPTADQPILKPKHAHWIKSQVYKTLKNAGYTDIEKWLTLVFTGSLTTYQYSANSDVDISLFVNSKIFPEWSRAEMIALMVEKLDGKLLPGTPFPLQNFVVAEGIKPSDLYKPGLRSGYNIDNNKWIVPPERNRVHDVKSEQGGFYAWALQMADKMERLLKYEPEQAIAFWHSIHRKRREDMVKGKGDFSESNIIYKMLANRGLFPEISQASGEYIAKTASDAGEFINRLEDLPGAKIIDPFPNHEMTFQPGDRVTMEYSNPVPRKEFGLPGEGYVDLNSGTVVKALPDNQYHVQWDIGVNPSFTEYHEPGETASVEGHRLWPEGHENVHKALIDTHAPQAIPNWMIAEDLRREGSKISGPPQKPPHLRSMDEKTPDKKAELAKGFKVGKSHCGNCSMFWKNKNGKGNCWGYGEYGVYSTQVCDSWFPEEKGKSSRVSAPSFKQVSKFVYDPTTNRLLIGRMGKPEGEHLTHNQLFEHPMWQEWEGSDPHSAMFGEITSNGYGEVFARPRVVPGKGSMNPWQKRYQTEEAIRRAVPGIRFTNPTEMLDPSWELIDNPDVTYIGNPPIITPVDQPEPTWNFQSNM